MKREKDLRTFKCRNCGEEVVFDSEKIPANVSFDYKCKKCGSFNKVAIIDKSKKNFFEK